MPRPGRSCPAGLGSGLWALAGAFVPHLACPSATVAHTQQGPGANPTQTLAQPRRHAHAQDTFSLSPACMLCHRIQADTDICGDKRVKFKLCVHTYCQVTSPGLSPPFCPGWPCTPHLTSSWPSLLCRSSPVGFTHRRRQGSISLGTPEASSEKQPRR